MAYKGVGYEQAGKKQLSAPRQTVKQRGMKMEKHSGPKSPMKANKGRLKGAKGC